MVWRVGREQSWRRTKLAAACIHRSRTQFSQCGSVSLLLAKEHGHGNHTQQHHQAQEQARLGTRRRSRRIVALSEGVALVGGVKLGGDIVIGELGLADAGVDAVVGLDEPAAERVARGRVGRELVEQRGPVGAAGLTGDQRSPCLKELLGRCLLL